MGLKTLLKVNVTVLLLILSHNVTISRLNRIGRQLQMVKLPAGELAVNWQSPLAFCFFTPPRDFHATREEILSAEKSVRSKNNFRGITMGRGPMR